MDETARQSEVSKQEFHNYAWHKGNVTSESNFLQNLLEIEELAHGCHTDMAMEKFRSLLITVPDPPTESTASELENYGITCSPVRSALIFAIASVKYLRMGGFTSGGCSPKWCLKRIFRIHMVVARVEKAPATASMMAVSKFLAELTILTFDTIFPNPTSRGDAIAAAKSANFVAISCRLAKEKEQALAYSTRAVNLIQALDMEEHKETSARVYKTAGNCLLDLGNLDKANEYLRKARALAAGMDDVVPNRAKEELIYYIDKDLSETPTSV